MPKTQAKNRYLLLVDFRDGHDLAALRQGYLLACPQDGKTAAIRVIYVSRTKTHSFQIGGKKKGAPKKGAT